MNKQEFYWHVSHLQLSYRRQVIDALKHAGSMQGLEASEEFSLHEDWILKAKVPESWSAVSDRASAINCQILTLEDKAYPDRLREIVDPPPIIFVRGSSLELLKTKLAIAVVGSRNASIQACQYAHDFAQYFAINGVCVVSGLALGVDGAAHEGALCSDEKLSTIAVCANGLDLVYPARHRDLAHRILESEGAFISEFAPGVKSLPHHFLQRNRIIAGLSLGVLVVHAGEKSGSLVTARLASEEGRDVFVIPGSLDDQGYKGSLFLIKSGAALVTAPSEVFDALGIKSNVHSEKNSNPLKEVSSAEKEILIALKDNGPLHFAELQEFCNGNASLAIILLELELKGALMRLPANRYQAIY